MAANVVLSFNQIIFRTGLSLSLRIEKVATRTTTKVLTGLALRFFPRVSYRSSAVNSD
jgi:hypothetical protein